MFAKKEGLFMSPDDARQPRHASFTPDEASSMVPRSLEDSAPYPDLVYEKEPYAIPQAFQEAQPAWAQGGPPRKGRNTAFWLAMCLGCAGVLCLLVFFILSLYQAYPPFRERAAIVNQNTFAQGISVDGVSIGGLTREQAEAALRSGGEESPAQLRLTLEVGGKAWVITPRELPLERNLSAVLDTAYAIGRQGSRDTVYSYTPPFEYRYAHLYHTAAEAPLSLHTRVTYAPEKIWELIGIIETWVNREPVDAQVATFDFSSRSFTFTEEAPGYLLDSQGLYDQIADALNRRDYTGTIAASVSTLMPRVTRLELMNNFSLVSSYTTQTTANANRNNNIDLAAKAISGTVVMPGETFSFNQATGQRTAEKGYLPAAAIAGGATVDEIGGGVCQVSSTLFNAAAMADMTIVARSPHTWPSNYVDKGRDATVNWPNLDFQFRNDQSTPIFIVAYYRQRQCTVELYGASLGPGRSIQLSTVLLSEIPPPLDPVYEKNPSLPPGTVQEKKKARTGYVVDTYKVYLQNGVESSREKLCTSNYQMIQQVLEYNDF